MLISFVRFLLFAIQFRDLYFLVAKMNYKQTLESIRKYDPDCMYVHVLQWHMYCSTLFKHFT